PLAGDGWTVTGRVALAAALARLRRPREPVPDRARPRAGAARSASLAGGERTPLALGDLRRGRTLGLVAPSAVHPAVVEVLDLAHELVDDLVDRGLHVGRGLSGAQCVSLEVNGRLGHLRVGNRRVPFDGELDLDLSQIVDAAVELVELPLDIAPHRIVH